MSRFISPRRIAPRFMSPDAPAPAAAPPARLPLSPSGPASTAHSRARPARRSLTARPANGGATPREARPWNTAVAPDVIRPDSSPICPQRRRSAGLRCSRRVRRYTFPEQPPGVSRTAPRGFPNRARGFPKSARGFPKNARGFPNGAADSRTAPGEPVAAPMPGWTLPGPSSATQTTQRLCIVGISRVNLCLLVNTSFAKLCYRVYGESGGNGFPPGVRRRLLSNLNAEGRGGTHAKTEHQCCRCRGDGRDLRSARTSRPARPALPVRRWIFCSCPLPGPSSLAAPA